MVIHSDSSSNCGRDVFRRSSPGLLGGYFEMSSDKQFRIPNNFRFSFIVVIFRKKRGTGFHMTCLN